MTQPPKKARTKVKKDGKTTPRVQGELAPIKPNGGTPAHQPTQASRNLVLLCGAMGQTQEQMARLIGISETTLKLHYAVELKDGGQKILTGIAGNLARIAQDPNHPKCVTAAIFWLKTKGGFREVERTEDPDNPDEKVTFTINIGGSGPPQPGDKAKIVNA